MLSFARVLLTLCHGQEGNLRRNDLGHGVILPNVHLLLIRSVTESPRMTWKVVAAKVYLHSATHANNVSENNFPTLCLTFRARDAFCTLVRCIFLLETAEEGGHCVFSVANGHNKSQYQTFMNITQMEPGLALLKKVECVVLSESCLLFVNPLHLGLATKRPL